MNDLRLFAEYAAKFEEVYISDDWSQLEPFFHENAVYEMLGEAQLLEGRDAVFAGLKRSLDNSDRRFEKRELRLLAGPEIRDGAVWFGWRATYRSGELPPMVLEGEETLRFTDGRISHMRDTCPEEVITHFGAWMEEHGDKLPS